MKTDLGNMGLVVVGLVLLMTGLFRQFPVKVNKGFLWNIAPMVIMVVAVAVLACKYNQSVVTGNDPRTIIQRGIDGTMQISASFLFTIVLLMPLIGFSGALTPVFQKQIVTLLGGWSGWAWVFPLSFSSAGGSGYTGVIVHL